MSPCNNISDKNHLFSLIMFFLILLTFFHKQQKLTEHELFILDFLLYIDINQLINLINCWLCLSFFTCLGIYWNLMMTRKTEPCRRGLYPFTRWFPCQKDIGNKLCAYLCIIQSSSWCFKHVNLNPIFSCFTCPVYRLSNQRWTMISFFVTKFYSASS